jgi:hypothetical protein
MDTFRFVVENRGKIEFFYKSFLKRFKQFGVYCYDDKDKKTLCDELRKNESIKVINLDEDYKMFFDALTLRKIEEVKNTSLFKDYAYPLIKKYVNEFTFYHIKKNKIVIISSNLSLLKFLEIRNKLFMSPCDAFYELKCEEDRRNTVNDRIQFYKQLFVKSEYNNILNATELVFRMMKITK